MNGLGVSTHRQVWPAVLVAIIVLAGVLGAFLMTRGPLPAGDAHPGAGVSSPTSDPASDPTSDPSSTPGRTTETGTSHGALAALEVVRWGGHGDQLAVEVRNASDRTVLRAELQVVALDARGAPVGVASAHPATTCCTVLGLPPGASYGVFADLDVPVEDVAQVRVRYLQVRFADTEPTPARLTVSETRLRRLPGDTEVRAVLRATGDVRGFVVGQALLEDATGRLVGVISGRFYCFADRSRRSVRMQLLRPVPARTRVDRVLAYPIPAGETAGVPDRCPSDQETR
ncbi:hypothetical protein JK386_06280 [Nocardioides sp. zg-536]|uniref:Uncharacterized protein n=1 Tax=Nocardioides faecalis TaxID=2803858 RepID=A0A938Y793_9ACTN|nr:hypothetical protein [Nocardioides faecalis]MBM9459503.1 hypothetical protein [Nocardioides faecalis]QVI58041.1 hypothetical protein KG111_13575 [Nocardioides faecalis]